MKNLVLLLLVFSMLLSSCAWDNYDSVPANIERIVLQRPHAYINRSEGGQIKAESMKPGKWNHGNGPTLGLDFSTAFINTSINAEIKMRENISRMFQVNCNWNMIPGKTVLAALNFLPPAFVDSLDLSGMNSIETVRVPIQRIFDTNVLPFFDMASRDVVDEYSGQDLNIDLLSEKIHQRLITILSRNRFPRVDLGQGGIPVFMPSDSIVITDVLQINNVTVVPGNNPKIIEDAINAITMEKSNVVKAQQELDRLETRRTIALKEATDLNAISQTVKKLVAEHPGMMAYMKLKSLKEPLLDGNPNSKTTLFIIPEEMAGKLGINVNAQNQQ